MIEDKKPQQNDEQSPQLAAQTDSRLDTEKAIADQNRPKQTEDIVIATLFRVIQFRWFVDFWKRDWQRFITDVRKLTPGERLVFYVAFVGLLGAAGTVRVMTLTLQEIHDGGADTHQLAFQASLQSRNMRSVSDAADKIRQAAENMVKQDTRIADNAQKAMDASNRQNKAALDATIATSQLDERAWVGIGNFRITQFEKGKSLKVDIEIFNSGKTPALQTEQVSGFGYELGFPVRIPPSAWFNGSTKPFIPFEAIPPQGRYSIHSEIPEETISQLYDPVKSRDRTIYVFGEIRYKNISGASGDTEYCLFMSDPDKPDLAFCNAHNDMK